MEEDENPNLTDKTAMTNGNGESTMTVTCRCGKICKNSRGLKIHQARKKCLEGDNIPQRTDSTSDEMREEPDQEHPIEPRASMWYNQPL